VPESQAPTDGLEPKMLAVVAGVGAACLLVALTGADVEVLGVKIAGGNRTALGAVGIALLLAAGGRAWWRHNVAPVANDSQNQEQAERPPLAVVVPIPPKPQPTPWFVGRKRLLAELRRQMKAGRPVVLTGLGGVGKTQLALACLGRHLGQGGRGWWLRAEKPTTLVSDYAALATSLGLLQSEASDQEKAVAAVRAWLEANADWLLVFDNATDLDSIAELLPDGDGQILITSRSWDWPNAQVVQVQPWSREESLEFLQRHAHLTDEATADELADQLGDLPLALEQARAYMRRTQLPPTEYLELLRDRAHALFARGKPASYQDQVATTWSLSLDQLRREAPAAEDLLALCAFLAPEDIGRSLFTEHPRLLPDRLRHTVQDALAYNDLIGALGRYSLVTVSEESLSVHRLVQAVVRTRLGQDDERGWVKVAIALMDESFPLEPKDVTSWPTFQRLLPHVLAATEHAMRLGVASREIGNLLSWASGYLRERGQPRQARPLAERAVAVTEAAFPSNHPAVAERHDELGRVLLDLGDLPTARAEFKQALAIVEAAHGPDDPQVALARMSLGLVLRDLGDLPAARDEFQRALAITETAYGPEDPHVAVARSNLGAVVMRLGDLPAARDEFQRALSIVEAAYGPDHPEVGAAHNNVGMVLMEIGDLPAARAELERGLSIGEVTYGPDHPKLANARSNLGMVLAGLGDLSAARAQFEQALAILEGAYGPDHPATQRIRRLIQTL
jgi:tetratricopeptide (TPR) repeat protein